MNQPVDLIRAHGEWLATETERWGYLDALIKDGLAVPVELPAPAF